MIPQNIKSPSDLVTTHAMVREGFLRQALSKTQKAEPYVAEAIKLQGVLASVDDIKSVINRSDILDDLFTAAGFSAKAMSHLNHNERKPALAEVLNTIALNSPNWRDEILFRYLLTKGDSLGGKMRNVVGAESSTQFVEAILASLEKRMVTPRVVKSDKDAVQEIRWTHRVLLFNKKPAFFDNNVDCLLIQTAGLSLASAKDLVKLPTNIIACGELKGGIDPAGADEHWKTANTAFGRIRDMFKSMNQQIHLFFAGAAIAQNMANELFAQLKSGQLEYAANLTSPEQVSGIADWLTGL